MGTYSCSDVGACGEVEPYVVHEDGRIGEAFLVHTPSRTEECMLPCSPDDSNIPANNSETPALVQGPEQGVGEGLLAGVCAADLSEGSVSRLEDRH